MKASRCVGGNPAPALTVHPANQGVRLLSAYQFQLLPALAATEYDALKADIAANGVMVPVEVDQSGVILDGHHRVQAWTELTSSGLELPEYPRLIRRFDDEDSRIEHALKLNLQRRHLTREQLKSIALDLRSRGWSYRRIGDVLAVSHMTVERWIPEPTVTNVTVELPDRVIGKDGKSRPATRPQPAVLANNDAEQRRTQRYFADTPEVVATGSESVITTEHARRHRNESKRQAMRDENEALVTTATGLREHVAGEVFSSIVIDPPWNFDDEGDDDQFGRGRPTYAAMTVEEIAALPIGEVAAANAHCYLWITNRSLPKGFALLEAWGFRYITTLTWCKPSIGMGNYFRGSTEHVIFGIRGSLGLLRRDVGTWFTAPRGERHSQKPDAFYQLVESCSPGPWLDVFARADRPGWVTWGAEV